MAKWHVLLINPFTACRYLSDELKKYNVKTTVLYTLDISGFSSYLKPSPNLFDEQIHFLSTDVDAIIKHLGERKFDFVINGFEGEVEIADKLTKVYTPDYANNPDTFLKRSDKYEMHQALAKDNLPHINQYLYSCNDPLPDLANLGLQYPCFVKPLASNASIGAYKIDTPAQLEKYFTVDRLNFNSICETEEKKDRFLIAEFVEGGEACVDTFSIEGKHYISSIYKIHKRHFRSGVLYSYIEAIKNDGLFKKISAYIFQVLNATGLFNGFAHTEIFLMPDGELKLVEVNPRISGASGMLNKVAKLSGGLTQIDLFVKYALNITPLLSVNSRITRGIVLYNLCDKPLYDLQQKLSKWSSVHEVTQLVANGHIQSGETLNLINAVALVILCASDSKTLDKHTNEILEQDKRGW